jgi:hypothetical protein
VQVLDRTAEGFDVALIFDRERPFLSWNPQNPTRAVHDAARMAVVSEVLIVVVVLVTLLNDIAPWSTTGWLVPAAFLLQYGGVMLFHLATPYLVLSPGMLASVMRHRVLAPAYAWLYFLNLSRFGVDRRGHFRAVGETTTADLVTYKQKQREAKEEVKAKAVRAPHPLRRVAGLAGAFHAGAVLAGAGPSANGTLMDVCQGSKPYAGDQGEGAEGACCEQRRREEDQGAAGGSAQEARDCAQEGGGGHRQGRREGCRQGRQREGEASPRTPRPGHGHGGVLRAAHDLRRRVRPLLVRA